jgi:3-oxoacyl-[acyl-carrier protein] reductase
MARIQSGAMILETDEEEWEQTLANNLKSCYLCSRAVTKIMVERKKGNIINISSVMAYAQGRSLMSPYSISKRGMNMLTEGLASDLAKYNIRVNGIAPGGIRTEMMRYVWAIPERLKREDARMPLSNALLPPSICANAALFLASELSNYITGQTIIVDSGLMVTQPV